MGPPPQPPPPQQHNTRQKQYRKKESANFVAVITDKSILKPVNPQLEDSVMNYETRTSKEYKHLFNRPEKDICMTSFSSELGYLSQGVGDHLPTCTDADFFHPQVTGPQDTKSHV